MAFMTIVRALNTDKVEAWHFTEKVRSRAGRAVSYDTIATILEALDPQDRTLSKVLYRLKVEEQAAKLWMAKDTIQGTLSALEQHAGEFASLARLINSK